MLASKMIRVAHIPNKLQIPRAANTDSPTIKTPVRPTPTLLYTSTAQEEEPAGTVPSAKAMYSSMTKYDTATVAESEAVSRASSSSTERSEEKLSLRLASAARSLRRVWASSRKAVSQAKAASLQPPLHLPHVTLVTGYSQYN